MKSQEVTHKRKMKDTTHLSETEKVSKIFQVKGQLKREEKRKAVATFSV